MEFGEWLRRKRQARDMTQETFAEAVNCSVDTVRKIEAGRRRPSRQLAEILADYFNLPVVERAAFMQMARGLQDGSDSARQVWQEWQEWQAGETPGRAIEANPNAAAPAPPKQIDAATAEHSPATIRATPPPAYFFPFALTPLVGRESELAEIRSLLWRATTRLVTLIGPPGIGKTRLAQAAAAILRDDFKDGTVYVPLISITDPGLVASTLARSLGLSEGQTGTVEGIQAALYNKQMLIVLDNFEQVLQAAPVVANLLAAASQVKILVTSRASLHLHGEKLVDILPLALPDPKQLPSIEELGRIPSVALFVERAQDAVSSFRLTPANAALVAQICAQLDGLPLAIELAAARTRLLSLAALHTRLERQLEQDGQDGQDGQPGQLGLLTGGHRDAPTHQQTLRRAIESSYYLLPEHERRLFRRLGIFSGAFTLEAAKVVAGATLDGMDMLLDQSLIRREVVDESVSELSEGESTYDGEMRFSMLASIREYGYETLNTHGETREVAFKHACYLLDLARSTKDQVTGPNEKRWAASMEAWLDDFRSAMRWTIGNGEFELALRLATELYVYWRRDHLAEGARWVDAALAASSNIPLPDALHAQGLQVASLMAQMQGDYQKSRLCSQQSLPLFSKLQDKHGMALAFSTLGVAAAEEKKYDEALSLLEQSLNSWRELGNQYNAATLLINMSLLAIRMNDNDRATELAKEAEKAFHMISNVSGAARAKITLGLALLHKGNYAQSMQLHRECLALVTELDNRREVSRAHAYLGLALLAQDNHDQARRHYRESLLIAQEIEYRVGILKAILGLAGAEAGSGRAQRAVRLMSAANANGFDGSHDSSPAEEDLRERTITKAHETLSEVEYGAAWTAGQGMSLPEAEQYALHLE